MREKKNIDTLKNINKINNIEIEKLKNNMENKMNDLGKMITSK